MAGRWSDTTRFVSSRLTLSLGTLAPIPQEGRTTMPTVGTILGSVYVDDQGEPGEPAALLWPSLFTDHRMWRHQIAPLREAGWRTLALDPPGHGRSPGPGRGFTMDECAQAAIQVLDAAGVRAPAAVLGTSWGGFVAPRIAMLAPTRLSGMVLFNTSAERGTPFERTKATLLTRLLAIGALDKMTARMIVSGFSHPKPSAESRGSEAISRDSSSPGTADASSRPCARCWSTGTRF